MFGAVPETEFDLRFSAFGVPVRVHPVFWLTSAFLGWEGDRLDYTIINVLCIFVAILVHELGHALVTRRFGWHPEIVLYFFGGYATTSRHSTWRDIAVSAAGPAAGFLLFGVCFATEIVLYLQGITIHPLARQAILFSLFINFVWNVMNLVPVLPLDGGHISREFLCWLRPRGGMRLSLQISMVAAGAIALWALYSKANNQGVLGLDPLFLGLMFGYLSFQSYQSLQEGYW